MDRYWAALVYIRRVRKDGSYLVAQLARRMVPEMSEMIRTGRGDRCRGGHGSAHTHFQSTTSGLPFTIYPCPLLHMMCACAHHEHNYRRSNAMRARTKPFASHPARYPVARTWDRFVREVRHRQRWTCIYALYLRHKVAWRILFDSLRHVSRNQKFKRARISFREAHRQLLGPWTR